LSTLSGIANIVSAVAGVAALISKPKGFSEHMWYLSHIQQSTESLNDYVRIEIGSNSGWLARILDKINAQHLGLQATRKMLREKHLSELKGMGSYLEDIASNTAKIAKEISKLKGAQAGHVSTKTELVMLHGSSANPEFVLPASDFRAMTSPSGRGGTSVNIYVTDQLDPHSAQRITRDQIIPEMLNALDAHYRIDEFRQKMGV
jgi:hypothetical protein